VAVTVMVEELAFAALEAVSVSVLAPDPPVKVDEENAAVTPVGMPAMVREMGELKPFTAVVVSVNCAVPPADALTEVALEARVKLAGAVTVRLTAVVCVKPPPVAVT